MVKKVRLNTFSGVFQCFKSNENNSSCVRATWDVIRVIFSFFNVGENLVLVTFPTPRRTRTDLLSLLKYSELNCASFKLYYSRVTSCSNTRKPEAISETSFENLFRTVCHLRVFLDLSGFRLKTLQIMISFYETKFWSRIFKNEPRE